MTTDQSEALSFVKRCAEAADRFKADMKAQDIHVGLGARDPRCVTCDERWPCAVAQENPAKGTKP